MNSSSFIDECLYDFLSKYDFICSIYILIGFELEMKMLAVWVSSLRLKTIPLACCGIVTGNALSMAYDHKVNLSIFIFSLLTAVALQVMSNLANDYGDVVKGTDKDKTIGAERGLKEGLITPQQMQFAIIFTGFIAIAFGIVLIILACHTFRDVVIFIMLGLLSMVAAILYTVGDKAYGYYGLGDLSVLLFFGYASVMGSFFLQTHHVGMYSFLPATAAGLLSVIVLNVNNIRDINGDVLYGKRTIPVRLGALWSRYYHFALLVASIAFLGCFAFFYAKDNGYVWLFLLALPLYFWNGYAVYHYRETAKLHKQLAVAIKINIFTLSLFSIGLVLG